MVQDDPRHRDAVDYEHAYDHEDGWNEHEHGWERERKTSRQRKTSSIVREALLRAGALERLRAEAESEAEKHALNELKVQSEAQLQFHLEADGQQDAGPDAIATEEEGQVQVQLQDECDAYVDVVDLSGLPDEEMVHVEAPRQVYAQVHAELLAEVQNEVTEEVVVLAHTLTETKTENGVDTFTHIESETSAEDMDNENEAGTSAEVGFGTLADADSGHPPTADDALPCADQEADVIQTFSHLDQFPYQGTLCTDSTEA